MKRGKEKTTNIEILLVQGSSTQGHHLEQLLAKEHYHVTLVANGEIALQSLADHLPDMVIADIVIPKIDGYELCRYIRSKDRTRAVQVMLVTALSDPADAILALEAGADSFIRKPYKDGYLLARVREMTENRTFCESSPDEDGVPVSSRKHTYVFRSERQQVVDLLLSTYKTAVEQNEELCRTGNELRETNSILFGRSEALQEINEGLEAFSFSVSHDLKAPLRIIRGFAKILGTEHASNLDAEGLRILKVIQDNAKDMGRLIDDLLTFSRVIGRGMTFEKVNMHDLVQKAWAELGPSFADRTIAFALDPLPSVAGDRSTLREVVVNLLSNAIKFTRPNPDARVQVTGSIRGTLAVFSVRDNGVGFSSDTAANLFRPFHRLHDQNEFEGSGIGLALVRRIVQRHGGLVSAESTIGKGSEFTFTLLLNRAGER